MLDIKFVRNNPDVVKENIKKKFQDEKLPLVDEVLELDQKNREIKQEVEALRADRNKISKEIGACMAQGKKEEAEELKKKVQENADRVESLSAEEKGFPLCAAAHRAALIEETGWTGGKGGVAGENPVVRRDL